MKAFATAAQDKILEDAIKSLRLVSVRLQRNVSEDHLRSLAESGIRKAFSFGIDAEDEQLRFLCLLLKHGPQLDEMAVPGYLLRNSRMSVREKLQALEDWDRKGSHPDPD